MADANNILNRPFGLNIRLPERTLKQAQESAINSVNLFSPMMDYLEDNDKVFSGDVSREIDKYNRMAYSLGSIMRDGKAEVSFDTRG